MLRASIEKTGQDVEWSSICQDGTLGIDPKIPDGMALLRLTQHLIRGDKAKLVAIRSSLVKQRGKDVVVRAIGVAANFQMMNRLLDATGVPVQRRFAAMAEVIGYPSQDSGTGESNGGNEQNIDLAGIDNDES